MMRIIVSKQIVNTTTEHAKFTMPLQPKPIARGKHDLKAKQVRLRPNEPVFNMA